MLKESGSEKKFPYNVINSPVAKVVLATSLLTSIGANVPVSEHVPGVGVVTAEAASGKQLINAYVGETIKFGGADWVVLDPFAGLVQRKQPISMKALDTAGIGKFDVNDPNNVAYFLNTTWFNMLKPEEQALIQMKQWTLQKRLWFIHRHESTSWNGNTGHTDTGWAWAFKDFYETVDAKVGIMDTNIGYGPYYNLAKTTGGTELNLFINTIDNRQEYTSRSNSGSGNNSSTPLVPPATYLTVDRPSGLSRDSVKPAQNASDYNRLQHTYTLGLAATTPSYVQPFIYLDTSIEINGDGSITANYAPTIVTSTPNNMALSSAEGNNKFKISGTVKDSNVGDTLYVKYTIDGIPYHTDNNVSYFTANGGNQAYETEIKIDANIPDGTHNLRIWVEDQKGAKSADITRTFTVDQSAPTIDITGVENGKVYSGSVTPIVKITDTGSPTHTMTLNGTRYTGDPITLSGKYTLIVEAKDAANNTATKTVKFDINQTPSLVGSVANKSLDKGTEETIDLSSLFTDADGDDLTYTVSSSDPAVVSATKIGNNILVKTLGIGTATISVTANDGFTESPAQTFDVQVLSRTPVLTVGTKDMVLLENNKDLKITGTIVDPDLEDVVVTATVNGVEKTETISSTGSEDTWSIDYDKSSLPVGAFLLQVKAKDPFNQEVVYAGNTVIVKVPGTVAEYEPTLAEYEVDINKDVDNMTVAEHTTLLEAFVAMKELSLTNTKANRDAAKLKVDLLVNGEVKEACLKTLGSKLLEEVIQNPGNVTVDDLNNIGIKNPDPSLEKDYQEGLDDYSKDKAPDPLTNEDIQKVIDAINAVNQAKTNPNETTINNGFEVVNKLDDGSLKDKLLKELEDITIEYISSNPSIITKDLLEHAGLTIDSSLIDSYKEYLQDVLPTLTAPILKQQIQDIVDVVDDVWAKYKEAVSNPSQANVVSYEKAVLALEDGVFKNKMKVLIAEVAFIYLADNPSNQDADDYTRLNQTTITANINSYNENMVKYIADTQSGFTYSDITKVIDVTDKTAIAIATPTKANIESALVIARTLQDGKLKTDIMKSLTGKIIDEVNADPGSVTADDLVNLGIEHVDPNLIAEYQKALEDMKNDLGRPLTFDEIQLVINAINAVTNAEKTKDKVDIEDAYVRVNLLPKGTLQDKLLNRLKNISLDNIITDPSKTTPADLIDGGIKDVDVDLEKEYQDALKDYVHPLTEAAIQEIVNLVNQTKKAKAELTKVELDELEKLVTNLAASNTKTAYQITYNSLTSALAFEQDMTSDKFSDMNNLINTVTTTDKVYLENMSIALDFVSKALDNPSDAAVLEAQTKLSVLLAGDLKTRTQSRIGSAYLDHVINKPGDMEYEDLINAGLDNVTKENFDKIKDAITDITNEVGPLTKEQIQAIIDAINAVEVAKANPTESTINTAKGAVAKIPDSKVKTDLGVVLDGLWKSIQPKPKPPTGGGGGTVSPPTDNGSTVTPNPDKPTVTLPALPSSSDNLMMGKTENAQVLLELAKNEVSTNEEVKMKIKVQSVKDLKNSTLKMYIKPKDEKVASLMSVASIDNSYLANSSQYQTFLEIDIMDLINGTHEEGKTFKFTEEGKYEIKAVFENTINDKKEVIETNSVDVAVVEKMQIPNTVLPNTHGFAVATLKVKAKTTLYSMKDDGTFVKAKDVPKNTLLLIEDTTKSHYKLSNGLYAETGVGAIHVGKGEVRKAKVDVYDKDGKFIRTLKKGQKYKVYSYDNNRYSVGGGEFIKVQDGVTYLFGVVVIKETMSLYNKDGSVERTLKPGEAYRVYSIDKDKLNLGGGLSIKRDVSKIKFIKE